MKLEWQYTRTWRRHWVDDGEIYGADEIHCYLWDISSSAPYGQYQDKQGYDLYHKGKLIKHGKTVKELKQIAQLKESK